MKNVEGLKSEDEHALALRSIQALEDFFISSYRKNRVEKIAETQYLYWFQRFYFWQLKGWTKLFDQ